MTTRRYRVNEGGLIRPGPSRPEEVDAIGKGVLPRWDRA